MKRRVTKATVGRTAISGYDATLTVKKKKRTERDMTEKKGRFMTSRAQGRKIEKRTREGQSLKENA